MGAGHGGLTELSELSEVSGGGGGGGGGYPALLRPPFVLRVADIHADASLRQETLEVHEICLSSERTIFDKARARHIRIALSRRL